MTRLPISAIVLTLNESRNIDRCLKSLSFCDQTIVVDAGSTDGTQDIARRFTPDVVQMPWQGFCAQRNAALAHARHAWVLSVDADEVVSDALQDELRVLWAQGAPTQYVAYHCPRKTFHFGRWIRHGGWYPNRLVRLFRAECGRWEGGALHERWVTSGAVWALQQDLLHYSFFDLSDQVGRNNQYSSLGAHKLHEAGRRAGLGPLLVRPLWKFIETYFVKMGCLDGYPGFIISVSAAYSIFLKWAKLWELQYAQHKKQP